MVVVVTLKEGHTATQEEIMTICKGNLASYKKPKAVNFVDKLPKSSLGKVLKRELVEQYK